MHYFSREGLLIMLQEFVEENGRCPTTKDIGGDSGIPGQHAYKAVFGSFYNALVAAGLKPLKREDSSNAYLAKKLIILKQRIGKIPTAADLKKFRDMPSRATYEDRFGSLAEALRYAGFELPTPEIKKPKKPKKKKPAKAKKSASTQKLYTDEELLDVLRKFVSEHGYRPATRDMGGELPSDHVYRTHFGSLQKALELVGLGDAPRKETVQEKKYTDENVFRRIREIEATLGHVPSTREASEMGGLPAQRTIHKRYGPWKEFLAKAGIIVPKDDEPAGEPG